ncbi:NF-kappa-B-activating protein-like [Mytilus edulis]|uniref:NF-kappa-B-activating protein-like n=1 Tax=Mytilus edulis TaxID=6550 RepID=UPI0039EE21F5
MSSGVKEEEIEDRNSNPIEPSCSKYSSGSSHQNQFSEKEPSCSTSRTGSTHQNQFPQKMTSADCKRKEEIEDRNSNPIEPSCSKSSTGSSHQNQFSKKEPSCSTSRTSSTHQNQFPQKMTSADGKRKEEIEDRNSIPIEPSCSKYSSGSSHQNQFSEKEPSCSSSNTGNIHQDLFPQKMTSADGKRKGSNQNQFPETEPSCSTSSTGNTDEDQFSQKMTSADGKRKCTDITEELSNKKRKQNLEQRDTKARYGDGSKLLLRNRNLKENEYALSDDEVRQRQHREKQKKEQMRQVKETERKRKYRKRKREENINDQRQNEDLNMRNNFQNRTEKHRALKKLKLALPKTPDRDKPLVSLDDSPDYDSENDYELNKPEARKRGKSALLLLEEELRNDLRTMQNEIIDQRIEKKILKLTKGKRENDRKNVKALVQTKDVYEPDDTINSLSLRQRFSMNYKTWTKYCKKDKQQNRKRRSDAYSNEEKTNVESFYERHSTPLGQKQTIDKNEKQIMILITTTSNSLKSTAAPLKKCF